MKRLEGKVALITGASKGIGESTARLFAAEGASVAINSRKEDEINRVAASIRQAGGTVIAIPGNTGDVDARKYLLNETVRAFGTLDILVNNAAVNPVYGPLTECDERAFDKIIQVNLKAPFELAKLAYPHLKARSGSSVINISSIAGSTPDPGLAIYSVSKAALNMLTLAMAREWGPDGIRVNAICPGLVKTKLAQGLWENEKWLNSFLRHTPLGRMATPDEIARVALFLASEDSSYCTGALITADGGVTV
jgi:NAD(P)-dependent dehydrogenase (short-subunit alcohol dehydrogenase family)